METSLLNWKLDHKLGNNHYSKITFPNHKLYFEINSHASKLRTFEVNGDVSKLVHESKTIFILDGRRYSTIEIGKSHQTPISIALGSTI